MSGTFRDHWGSEALSGLTARVLAMGEEGWSVIHICAPIFHRTGPLSAAHRDLPYTSLHLCLSASPVPLSACSNPTKSLRGSLNTVFFSSCSFVAPEVGDSAWGSSAREPWEGAWQCGRWCIQARSSPSTAVGRLHPSHRW